MRFNPIKMKNTLFFSLILFFFIVFESFAQIDSVLVCNVKFKKSQFNNAHAGSGFLLSYKNKVYGITAKHVLFFAKTDSMKTISFGNELLSWNFNSKKTKTTIPAGKLINENTNEYIKMPPDGDWLIFEITEKIPKDITVYSLRNKPIQVEESLHFLGYPYKSEVPINITGKFIGFTPEQNLRLDVPKGNYSGCSGGPVLDTDGKLIGIVSLGYYDEENRKMVFEPASLDYFKQVIQ